MSAWMDSRTRAWALAAVVVGVVLFIGLELIEEPDLTPLQLLLELLSITPAAPRYRHSFWRICSLPLKA